MRRIGSTSMPFLMSPRSSSLRREGGGERERVHTHHTTLYHVPGIDASRSTCPFWAHPDPLGPLDTRKTAHVATAVDAGLALKVFSGRSTRATQPTHQCP